MMRVGLSLRSGQPGTKGLLKLYGKSLICVRYRYDERTKQRIKTVELIVDRCRWQPVKRRLDSEAPVTVRVDWHETELRQKVKAAGGKWDPVKRVGRLGREQVENLGMESQIVDGSI